MGIDLLGIRADHKVRDASFTMSPKYGTMHVPEPGARAIRCMSHSDVSTPYFVADAIHLWFMNNAGLSPQSSAITVITGP